MEIRARGVATAGASLRTIAGTLALSIAAAVIAGLALPAGSATAHAGYESSTPAENEVVPESPETVDVVFSQEMRRSEGLPDVFVVNEAGDTISLASELSDDDRTLVTVDLPPALPNGRYTVIWHTLSDEDGEEANGAFHFFVGEGPTDGGDTPAPTGTADPGEVTATPAATEPPSTSGDDDDGIPVWGLIAGIIAAAVVAGGAGIAFGRTARV